MSKISKKLLSLVIVLAMVLSMTPVISLPAAAIVADPGAEQDPAAAAAQNIADVKRWIADNGAKFDGSETVTATCPFCGAEDQTWEGIASWGTGSTADKHFYLTADYEGTASNFFVATSGVKTCLYTNGKDITGTRARFRLRGTPLNIIAYDSVITRNDGSNDYVLLQDAGANNTVNIYGGTFINNDPDIALIQRTQSTTTYNLYEGSYSSATTNVVNAAAGTTNAFNCTFTGGTTTTFEVSGGVFNMYGGSITGTSGGNMHMTDGEFNMYSGSISGGTGYVIGNYDITDETTGETTTYTATNGGNIYMAGGEFNMHGGSIYGGTATGVKTAEETYGSRGGNVYIGTDSTFNMYGGSIYGGRINSVNGAVTYGGNVMLYNDTSRLNMSGDAEIYGGQATNGGNVMMRRLNEMTMTGNAKVYNGVANTGPNIYLMKTSSRAPKLTMSGNALVYGGTQPSEEEGVPGDASNIRLYGGTLIMKDDAIVRGGAKSGSAISVMFNQNALIVLMGKATVKNETGTSSRLINDGRILITEGWAGEAYAALLHDDEKAGYGYGEQVATTRALRGTYNEDTGEVTATDATFTGKLYVSSDNIEALADPSVTGGIVLAEKPATNEPVFGTFNPAGCEGLAYCEACYKQALAAGMTDAQAKEASLKEWTPYEYQYNTNSDLKQTNTHEHLYLTETVTSYAKSRLVNLNAGTICLNLNGQSIYKDPSVRSETVRVQGTGVLNIMDEKMEGKGASVITGSGSATVARGATIYVEGGTCNLYGGTFKDVVPVSEGAEVNMIFRNVTIASGATLNVYEGAVIDGTNVETSTRANVHVSGTLNLDGGEIIGRKAMTGGYGGSVRVTSSGTFNMKSGIVRDGQNVNGGGNVSVEGGTFNMSGGHIYGGESNGDKKNVWVMDGGKMVMSGTAKITGLTDNDTAIRVSGTSSLLVLKDQATVLANDGSISGNVSITSNDEHTGARLVVDPNWTGSACVYLITYGANTEDGANDHGFRNGETLNSTYGICGTYDAATGTITPGGTFTGILHSNNENRPIYAKAATGELYVPGFTIETAAGRTWKTTFAEALESYQVTDAAYIGVWYTTELALTEDAYVALMINAEPTVSGAYKLYAMDTTQDDYAGTVYGWTVAEETDVVRDVKNPLNGFRYLNITTAKGEGSETIASTRLNLALSTVTLRAGKTSEGMGLYYKARMSMSEALANKVTTYGVVLSLVDMPYANFADEGKQNGFTAIEEKLGVNAENGYTVTVNSGSVFGIMKEDAEKAADNAQRGKMPIFANAYLEIDLDGDGNFEYIMADTDPSTENDVAWSLYDVLDEIDERWSEFAPAQQQKVTEFHSFWSDYGMDKWSFTNIKKA